jgi:hypothetical protein
LLAGMTRSPVADGISCRDAASEAARVEPGTHFSGVDHFEDRRSDHPAVVAAVWGPILSHRDH